MLKNLKILVVFAVCMTLASWYLPSNDKQLITNVCKDIVSDERLISEKITKRERTDYYIKTTHIFERKKSNIPFVYIRNTISKEKSGIISRTY